MSPLSKALFNLFNNRMNFQRKKGNPFLFFIFKSATGIEDEPKLENNVYFRFYCYICIINSCRISTKTLPWVILAKARGDGWLDGLPSERDNRRLPWLTE